MTTGTRTQAPPAPDTRIVTIDVGDLGALALGELAELGELTGQTLDELRYRLKPPPTPEHPTGAPPDPDDVIKVALALAVIIERREDPTLELKDARRWDIRLVTVDPDPTRPRTRRAAGKRKRS